jgi:hypothetical protein
MEKIQYMVHGTWYATNSFLSSQKDGSRRKTYNLCKLSVWTQMPLRDDMSPTFRAPSATFSDTLPDAIAAETM